MPYTYDYQDHFFERSTWDADIHASFGLIPPPPNWLDFAKHIEWMKSDCEAGESVKVFYAARHGQAEHNIQSEKYGLPDDVVHHLHPILDPLLTPLGRTQALRLSSALQREMCKGMPVPERWFVSPLRRTGETCGLEWGWMFHDEAAEMGAPVREEGGDWGHAVPAEVIENLREHLHVHQCDSRLPVSQLRPLFPTFSYPPGMPDEDTVWQPEEVRGRETEEELVARGGRAIEEILDTAWDQTYISLTSHSGALRGVYKALGVPRRPLVVGEMNVLVLRVRRR